MTKQQISTGLCLLFLSAILVLAAGFNASKPQVLILHSYNAEYAWTRDIDAGLNRVLNTLHGVSVSRHYMDTKRHADPRWLQRAGIIARRAIERIDPRVLIAVDDLAQELAAKHYVDDPGIDIVFAGINAGIEAYGYHQAGNVTGIFERKALAAVKEAVLALQRGGRPLCDHPKLLYVMDPSPSLRNDRPLIDAFDWQPVTYLGSHVARDFAQWKEIVNVHSRRADVLMVANYRKLPRSAEDPTLVDAREVMQWTDRHSAAPVIGINAFNVEDGAMLSIGPSPYEQGEVAAQLARRIITEDIRAEAIPMQHGRQYVVAIHRPAMERRRLELPLIYEAYAHFVSRSFQAE